jgi:hydrogenase-4 membrane subunit HyfE
VADNEPVTSPDQHKPTNLRLLRAAGVASALVLLLCLIGNHRGKVEDLWIIGVAVLLLAMIVVDWVLRRNGLRS